jgi:hypothetical protein
VAQPGRSLLQRGATQGPSAQQLRRPDVLGRTLLAFARHYEQIAKPFKWKFTRHDLNQLLNRSTNHSRSSLLHDHATRQQTCETNH